MAVRNRAKMTTATTGAGTITLGAAVPGFQTFAAALVANAEVVPYVIEDGTAWEIGTGTYTTTGTTLSRTLVASSTGALLSLTGNAQVYITPSAADWNAKADLSGAAFTGNISAANLSGTHTGTSSGTNTGDQTLASLGAQAALGFTPVRQGGGVGQLTNTVYIGWSSGGRVKATIDSTDIGNIAFDGNLPTRASLGLATTDNVTHQDLTASRGNTTGVIYLGNTGTKYLYYDGTNYVMPGANLVLNGASISGIHSGTSSGTNTGDQTSVSGNAGTATLATKSSTLSQNGGNGSAMTFNWSGSNSTPSWVWGGSDGVNHSVWAPAHFRVANADAVGDIAAANLARKDTGNLGLTNIWQFQSNQNTTGSNPPLQAYSSTGGAIMSFHRGGAYAINMGLDSDNWFRMGGWSAPANLLQMDMAGNLTMAGNVGAYSDARLKENIRTIPNALANVNKMRGVLFDLIDSGKASSGVIAQELQKIAPELVTEVPDGTLGVVYGNLVGYMIEAIKELTAKVEQLEAA